MRNWIYIQLVTCLFLLACNDTTPNEVVNARKKEMIIEYLKTQFKIDPQVRRFDTAYLNELLEKKESLHPDSLIGSRIKTIAYGPLHLNFIEYDNRYEYKDKTRSDFFSINLIEDSSTGKIYVDYINDEAGINKENWCLFQRINNRLDVKNRNGLSAAEVTAYNSINSFRTYGDFEITQNFRKTGVELYLNDAFRFSTPSALTLDSLFEFYDRHAYQSVTDTLIKIPDGLYTYLATQAHNIKSHTYGGEAQQLIYLKDQVALLLLKTAALTDGTKFLWVYRQDNKLRVRSLLIKGNVKSGYTYFIEEHSICF